MAFVCGFVQGADRTMQQLILQEVERLFEIAFVFLGQAAVHSRHDLRDNGLAFGIAILG